MRRRTQQRLLAAGRLLTVAGLALAVVANLVLTVGRLGGGWWTPALALPGLAVWGLAAVLPRLLVAGRQNQPRASFRLVYDAGPDWSGETARQALAGLARACGWRLGLAWSVEGEGTACRLSVPPEFEGVLRRLVGDVFPGGELEEEPWPQPEAGAAVLHWQEEPPPPWELARQAGGGLRLDLHGPDAAMVILWGPQAEETARQYAGRGDILVFEKGSLPVYTGDHPWPDLPGFPPSAGNPGLAATSPYERLEPAFRAGPRALVLGRDGAGQAVGFDLPELAGLRHALAVGQQAGAVLVELVEGAVRAGLPVLLLDGEGGPSARLSRLLFREIAGEQVLVCDAERPAQSRFRLNPLWLPGEQSVWPEIFSAWRVWLRELGVTPAGLGQAAYRHTWLAVVLAALAAARPGLLLDPAGLREALESPDFLRLMDEQSVPDGAALVGQAEWQWWLAEGRTAASFDRRLQLGHLRERLAALLKLPEYEMLWSPPYLDPQAVGRVSLVWRLPDPRRRLRPYVSSQLLAVAGLLRTWPAERPLVVATHEVRGLSQWRGLLLAHPGVRLLEADACLPAAPVEPELWLISRLRREDAETIAVELDGVRPADLRRLPAGRLVLRRGEKIGTMEREPEGMPAGRL